MCLRPRRNRSSSISSTAVASLLLLFVLVVFANLSTSYSYVRCGSCLPFKSLRLRHQSYYRLSSTTAIPMTAQDFDINSIAKRYGLPGNTDPEGFDPYADTVGPGIYGGNVKRDADGNIIIGEQYQNHNHRPGPIYDGTGYSLMSRAIHRGKEKMKEILQDYPELIHEISTGGARPLHICGMSKQGQLATQILIDAGADLYALDTYNYNALHRMASNDLHIGAEALVKAGMDPNYKPPASDSSPMDIAKRSRAIHFLMTMQKLGYYN